MTGECTSPVLCYIPKMVVKPRFERGWFVYQTKILPLDDMTKMAAQVLGDKNGLPCMGSNHDKEIHSSVTKRRSLLCYHYTTGQ